MFELFARRHQEDRPALGQKTHDQFFTGNFFLVVKVKREKARNPLAVCVYCVLGVLSASAVDTNRHAERGERTSEKGRTVVAAEPKGKDRQVSSLSGPTKKKSLLTELMRNEGDFRES